MEILKYKNYEGTAELNFSRLSVAGKVLFIQDVVTYESLTLGGIQQAFEEAVDDYLETCKELGRQPQKPLKGQFNVRIPPELHKAAVVRAAENDTSLNDVVVQALSQYLCARSDVNNHILHVTVNQQSGHPATFFSSASLPEMQWQETAYVQ